MAEPSSNPAPPHGAVNKYDADLTKLVINSQHILHVSFITKDSEYPSVCYLVGKILKYKSNSEALYVHGHIQEAVKGRLEFAQEEGDPGLSVSIAASTIHSYYLGFSGFASGFTFANTVLNGTASLMNVSDKDRDEREWVMTQIVNAQISDRWKHLRPIKEEELDYVSIIKITPNAQKSHTYSVPKILGFETQKDVKDLDICRGHWEGAIPVWQTLGQPISGKHNEPDGEKTVAPKYVIDFIVAENAKNEKHSREIAGLDYPYDLPNY
ncbi:hypothetical protein G7Y89_g11121 [Cudoniella acicularis]|uniref:Uncharacterized protein n=1 Tax=Cudoniella acicularis TaxID=354080 RepID=A0A8H4RF30_9HELO|nr:hypothetical protein G7Y89_g11121 [Cudoniella acicularis]